MGDSTLPPSRWNASQSLKGFEVQHWKDLSPRAGIAYDLSGSYEPVFWALAVISALAVVAILPAREKPGELQSHS